MSKCFTFPIKDIVKPGDTPYLIIGGESTGKTTLLLDTICNLENKYDKIYYISENTYNIPLAMNNPDKLVQMRYSFPSLCDLWNELKSNPYIMIEDELSLNKVFDRLQEIQPKELIEMILAIYPKSEHVNIISYYNEHMKCICGDFERNRMSIYILKDLILKGVNKYGYTYSDALRNINKIIKQQKILLIIDDIVSSTNILKTANTVISYHSDFNDIMMPISRAQQLLFMDILCKSRRYGITLMMSFKSGSEFDVKYQIKNYIITDKKCIDKSLSLYISKDAQTRIDTIKDKMCDYRAIVIKSDNVCMIKINCPDIKINKNIYEDFISQLIYVPTKIIYPPFE